MTQQMIEPLRIAFDVECSPDHAFDTWTGKATSWWPPEHTVSHERGATIVFEPRAGGRIFERTSDGTEIDWGRIVEWDRPRRIRYSWHIATDATNATDVSIHFRGAPGGTRIEIEHGGWERLGEIGQAWRDANHAGWDGVLPSYAEAAEARRKGGAERFGDPGGPDAGEATSSGASSNLLGSPHRCAGLLCEQRRS